MIGGAEIAIKEITDRLGGDFEFDLICPRINKNLSVREQIGSVDIWRVGSGRWGRYDKFLFPWRGFNLAKEMYPKKKYDLVWAIMASFGGLAALFFKEQFSGVPYVLNLQEGDTPQHIISRAKWLGPYYRRMFMRADFITAISGYLKEYAIKNGAVCPIKIVPNGVDIDKFSSVNRQSSSQFSREEFRKKLGISEGEKVIITVSRLVEKNGVGDLIEAVKQLIINDKQSAIRLLIAGSGELEKSLKSKVRNFCPSGNREQDKKLQDKILFLGEIPPDEVPKYLAISDIFVRPSLAEGLGNVFLEALAVGVPIIGTPVGGIPDFLKEGETGLFCGIHDPASIAVKINQILADGNLRQKLISNGKKLVAEKYDWTIIAPEMGKVFKQLITTD